MIVRRGSELCRRESGFVLDYVISCKFVTVPRSCMFLGGCSLLGVCFRVVTGSATNETVRRLRRTTGSRTSLRVGAAYGFSILRRFCMRGNQGTARALFNSGGVC